MLHDHLKTHTKVEHVALEKHFIQMIRDISNEADYANFLSLLYSYYSSVEYRIAPYLMESEIGDYAERRKSAAILDDLADMNMAARELESPDELPSVFCYYSALGVLYVFEGSTLGGQVIARMINERVGANAPMKFFRSYGENTYEMWGRFKEYLDRPYTDEQKERILSGAVQTFQTLKNWLITNDKLQVRF